MKKSSFLVKLKKEKKLQIVEPSEELCSAYTLKSKEYLQLAKLVSNNKFYEAGVVNAYYAMYYASLALLFICGIKSENHTATIMLLKELFGIDILMITQAKKDRVDSQYYLPDQQQKPVNESIAKQSIQEAELFCGLIRSYVESITNSKREEARKQVEEI